MSSPLTPRALASFNGRTHLPLPATGPFTVGCTDLATTNVLVRLFYPHKRHSTDKEQDAYTREHVKRWTKWFPLSPKYANGYIGFKFNKDLPGFIGKVFEWLAHDPYCPVLEEASLTEASKEDERLPVMVFSHGNGGCRATYSMLCYEMASQGHVVAAVEHADGSGSSSAHLVPTDTNENALEWVNTKVVPGIEEEDFLIRKEQEQVAKRGSECIEALNLLRDLNEGRFGTVRKPFLNLDGHVGTDKDELPLASFQGRLRADSDVVICGHSFGGGTVVKAMLEDTESRFAAGALFDGWMYPVKGEIEQIAAKTKNKPLLFLNYEKFQWKENLWRMGDILSKNESDASRCVTFKDSVHYTVTDLPTIMNGSYLSKALGFMEMLIPGGRRSSSSSEPEQPQSPPLSPELGLSLTLRIFTTFLKSLGLGGSDSESEKAPAKMEEIDDEFKDRFIEGTTFMGEEEEKNKS